MKRSWFEEEKKHRFLAEAKFRKFLKTSFRDFYSEFDEDVSAGRLATEIHDYLECSRETTPVMRGAQPYKASALELVQRTDLQATDTSELNSAAALIVLPNFRLIGWWIDRVRSTASDFGLDWTESQSILLALLRRYARHLITENRIGMPKAQGPKRRGRPPEEERARIVLQKRREKKSWKQVQQECNRELNLDLSPDAYRRLAKSRQQPGQKST
jgi:hypothetical protein